ncbi:MAG: tetratricopeptide repeat protein [Candidatus Rokubacteria bacterium]|nr:tetratricopeptide repeat protein [Candidatus Rokubacteria bacterium]
MNVLDWLREQPWARWVVRGLGAVIVVGLGWAGWAAWKNRYESQGGMAFAQARILVAQAQAAPSAGADARERAEKALQGVIADYPRLSSVAQAAYLLGSLRFGAAQYPQARSSFELARAKAGSSSLAALAALDIGYCWEAEKNYDAAEKAYLSTISGAKPKDFLYEEAMVDAARVQELGGKRAAAVETYQRLLKDLPDTRRAEEIRSRVASLQSPAKP